MSSRWRLRQAVGTGGGRGPVTMPPRLLAPLLAPLLVLLVLVPSGRCAVELHSAAGQHRAGLLALTPLQTVPAGPTMARRAHCLARCARLADCVSFNYGQLPDGITGCQLLGEALCRSGGGFSELRIDHAVDLSLGDCDGRTGFALAIHFDRQRNLVLAGVEHGLAILDRDDGADGIAFRTGDGGAGDNLLVGESGGGGKCNGGNCQLRKLHK